MYKYCNNDELNVLRASIEYIKSIKRYMKLGYKYNHNDNFILPIVDNEETMERDSFCVTNELYKLLYDSLGVNGDILENEFIENIIIENKLEVPYYDNYDEIIGISLIFSNKDIINLIKTKKYRNCCLDQFLMHIDLVNDSITNVNIQYAFNDEENYLIIVIPQIIYYTCEICDIFRACVDILEYIRKELNLDD